MNIVVVRLCYNEHVTVDATVSLHARAVAYVYSVLVRASSCIQVICASQYNWSCEVPHSSHLSPAHLLNSNYISVHNCGGPNTKYTINLITNPEGLQSVCRLF